jgi:hypothetical protein
MKREPLPHGTLLQAIMRGKDLPIDPLDVEEWGFPFWPKADLPKAQLGYCWEYERLREDKHYCQRIARYRAEFKSEVERIQQGHPEWSRAMCESISELFGSVSPMWLLRDFPEFPGTAWLKIPADARRERVNQYSQNRHSFVPESMEASASDLQVWVDTSGQPVKIDPRKDPYNEKGLSRIYEAPRIKEVIPGTFISWHVIKIEWKYRDAQLIRQFKQLLKKREPKGRQYLMSRTRGSCSPLEWLRWLGAFRLLRHCKGNWKVAAQMFESRSPKGRSLYSNESAWLRAAGKIEETLDIAPGRGEYDSFR